MAGPLGFFRGLSARVLYAMPATAICWSTYEFFKFYFCGLSLEKYKSSISGKNSLQPRESEYMLPSSATHKAEEKILTSTGSISQPTAAAIKTVCDLSSNVTNPTLNLNTRHTDVKHPFDRGFTTS